MITRNSQSNPKPTVELLPIKYIEHILHNKLLLTNMIEGILLGLFDSRRFKEMIYYHILTHLLD